MAREVFQIPEIKVEKEGILVKVLDGVISEDVVLQLKRKTRV